MIEKILSGQYGLAGICVLLTIMVIGKAIEIVWAVRKEKESLSEKAITDLTKAMKESTSAVCLLDHRLQHIEKLVVELPKFKTDLRRFYSALKTVSGDRWPSIRDEIMKDDFTL